MSARSTTSRRRVPEERPGRALVRGMTSTAAPFRIEFDARTVYDFMVSLAVEDPAEQDLLPEDRRWLIASRESLSPERRADLEACFGETPTAFCNAVGGLALEVPEARTARAFVGAVAVMGTRRIVRAMLAEITRDPEAAAQLERILDGAADEIPAFATRAGEYHKAGLSELLSAPTAWIDRIRGLLGEWVIRFEEVEERIEGMIQRDVEMRAEERRSLSPADLIERVTGGVRWLGEAGITRVVLSPSYFSRPYNYLYTGNDWRLFAYPVADAALDLGDEFAPPPAMIRLHRALGDESRLRILRLLRDRDMYLTELAQQLEVSKPTMKHHLALLRAAGLVTVTEEGSMTYYSLRRDRIAAAGEELRGFLG